MSDLIPCPWCGVPPFERGAYAWCTNADCPIKGATTLRAERNTRVISPADKLAICCEFIERIGEISGDLPLGIRALLSEMEAEAGRQP